MSYELIGNGEVSMSESAPSPKPLVDSYTGACGVCLCFSLTFLYFWKDYTFASLLVQLESGVQRTSFASPLPTWSLLPFALVPILLLPSPRILGVVPPATVLLGFAVIGQLMLADSYFWTQLVLLSVATVFVAVVRYLIQYIARARKIPHLPIRMRRIDLAINAACILSMIGLFAWHRGEIERLKSIDIRPFLWIATIAFFLFAWIRLFRPFFELCVEAKVRLNYRVTFAGPGTNVPIHGPIIVISNHACLWDPLFLAKALPRPVTPMMTSIFYDRWYIKPLVKYVFGTIRVPDARARRNAPEIQDAIRALDEGKCLMIFPESFLRRREEVPLRRFGRGIWEILKERPETPVVCCWIEGAWGSYSSHWNGPPGKNKPKEGVHAISIGMSEPIVIPKDVLGHHLKTRIHLMNEVSKARAHLGLEPLPTFDLPAKDDEPEQPA